MAKTVLFIVPNGAMPVKQRDQYATLYPHMDFASVEPMRPLDKVRKMLRETTEIVVGRGNTAIAVQQAYPNMHVVKIPITAYDVIRAINPATCSGKTLAVITIHADIIGLEIFADTFNIRILNYLLTPASQMHETICDAMAKGADIIIGGSITRNAAKNMGISVITFPLGPESIQQVLNEVQQIQAALEMEATRQSFVNKLMDNIPEGVVAVDTEGRLTTVNAAAKRLLGVSRHPFLGESLKTLAPELLRFSENEREKIVTIQNNKMMVSKIPIMHHERSLGAIYTLHESQRIENMENIIRKESYAKDHTVRYCFANILGKSPAVRQTIEDAKSYAHTDSNILITGESGSGKEVFAQSIHHESARRGKPFVAVNCAALPNELLQSELFGYVEGAFTGALRKGKMGLFEIAHGGSIFLDEIAEMDYINQGNLLRVIQERYVVRLGSHKPVFINTRIIAATNKNLAQLVQEGKFRIDLYYRLNVLAIAIPSLRQCRQDIVPMMLHFLNTLPSLYTGRFVLCEDAHTCLEEYDWPGNIRELHNVAERIAATAGTPKISRQLVQWAMQVPERRLSEVDLERLRARKRKKSLQMEEITRFLIECDGNLSEAARKLSINRTTLWRRMQHAGL